MNIRIYLYGRIISDLEVRAFICDLYFLSHRPRGLIELGYYVSFLVVQRSRMCFYMFIGDFSWGRICRGKVD